VSRVRVKVCGITRIEDAEAAVRAGADAVGFVFWPSSPRAIGVVLAAAIAARLPPFVARVGVFVNATPADVAACVRDAGLSAAQLHGDERVEDYRAVPVPLIRAVSLENLADVARALALPPSVTVLVDAVDPERRGGTGRPASWDLAAIVASRRPVILAGGLTPERVAEAVARVRPWGVDVSSGVESVPGVKDSARIGAFVAAVAAGQAG
jgi:phosphoribosylanthranilate isomerase